MFEKASRLKLRFDFKGLCSVEDLWDLTLKDLDNIYKELAKKKRSQNEDSLLNTRTAEDRLLDLRIDLVKHIVETKLAEKEARKAALEKKAYKQKLLAIKEKRQEEALDNISDEDLEKALADL